MNGSAELPAPADRLVTHLRGNPVLWECLERLEKLGLPDCYLGTGYVEQTVWNASMVSLAPRTSPT